MYGERRSGRSLFYISVLKPRVFERRFCRATPVNPTTARKSRTSTHPPHIVSNLWRSCFEITLCLEHLTCLLASTALGRTCGVPRSAIFPNWQCLVGKHVIVTFSGQTNLSNLMSVSYSGRFNSNRRSFMLLLFASSIDSGHPKKLKSASGCRSDELWMRMKTLCLIVSSNPRANQPSAFIIMLNIRPILHMTSSFAAPSYSFSSTCWSFLFI